MKKNDSWWYINTREDKSQEIMLINEICIKLYKAHEDSINAFQVYDIDAACIGMDDVNKYTSRTDMIMKIFPSREFEFLAFNLRNPVFSDISVRKAVEAAIDRQIILKEILNGYSTISDIPVHPDSWLLEGQKDASFDTDTAKTPGDILLEGGWKHRDSGYYKMFNGINKRLEIELLVNNNNSRRILVAERVCQQLLEAGIDAKVTRLPWNGMYSTIDAGKFDMVYTGIRISQIPDLSFLYSSSYLPSNIQGQTNKGRNISGYNSTEADNLIQKLYKETDNAIRKNLLASFKNIISNDLPYIGMFFLDNAVIYRKNVRGSLEPHIWDKYNDITAWYLPELQ